MSKLNDFMALFDNKRFKTFFFTSLYIVAILLIYWIVIFQAKQDETNRLPRLQNQCAAQSKKIADQIQGINRAVIYRYNYYYNDFFGKCFILLHGDGINQTGESDSLLDAYTQEEIAVCESHAGASEIDFCRFRGFKSVYSIANFKDFIKTYIGTTGNNQ